MTRNADLRGRYEWVVAVPEKRNYLSHLAPASNLEGWAARSVKTLCGWAGYAHGTDPDADSHYDKDGFRVRRRQCQRCVKYLSRPTPNGRSEP